MKDSTGWGLLGAAILTATGVGSYIFEKSAFRTAQESLRTAERLVFGSDEVMKLGKLIPAKEALDNAGKYIAGTEDRETVKPFFISQSRLDGLRSDYEFTSNRVATAENAYNDAIRKEMLDIQNTLTDRTPGHSPYHPPK